MIFWLLACALKAGNPGPEDAALSPVDDCLAFDNPALQQQLDRRTRSTLREGNDATLLVDGVTSFARRFENAQDAELIFVKTFIYTDDEAGREVAAVLAERARAGALVILQYDIKGSIAGIGDVVDMLGRRRGQDLLGNPPILEALIEAGVVVVPTNVPRSGSQLERWLRAQSKAEALSVDDPLRARFWTLKNFDHFDHEKYWITGHRQDDGSIELRAILGGMNIASEYAYGGTDRADATTGRGGWRDTDVELRGPVTNDILARYLDVLALNAPDLELPETLNPPQAEVGSARARFVWNQPAFANWRSVEWLYRTLLLATPTDGVVRLEVAYFTPGWRLRRSMRGSLRRDTRWAVLTNSPESTDVGLVAAASRGQYAWMLRQDPNAALYEWQSQPGLETLHAKVASFGTCGPAIVGSANLDGQSSEHNSESVVAIWDPEFRAEFDRVYERDIRSAQRMTPDRVERLGLVQRFWNLGVSRVGWYWLGE